jgi:DAPG hydrolase PhiG domain
MRPNSMTKPALALAAFLLALAIFGCNPFAPHRDTSGVLAEGYTSLESGIHRQGNGVYVVKALTRMPEVKAEMVRWWFADYMQTTGHYKRWHPTAHIWMDWENKVPGEVIGASHLVHEYIGEELSKFRIQFVEPGEFLEDYQPIDGRFIICARAGMLEEPLNVTSMCHVVRNTEWGAEMRSIFWLGHVSKREGNKEVFSIEGVIGNTALARFLLVNEQLARDLMIHAIQEMGYLSDFLPTLYTDSTKTAGEATGLIN